MSITKSILDLNKELGTLKVKLIAVSKTKSLEEILEAYKAGQRHFGENLVQELMEKKDALPADIKWHLIGHLQRNKVKYIAPFVELIHSVDSIELLTEINKQALKNNRVINCLLQVYIADEDTKYGLGHDEVIELLRSEQFAELKNVNIVGLMGIATNTEKQAKIKEEFYELSEFFKGIKLSFFRHSEDFKEICMGMSSDYQIAVTQGSTMVRIGSHIFGTRAKDVEN